MTNRLGTEVSPYLLQHKDNPVNWWPWGPQALAEAQRQNRPILLSVGYAACHWCHVMAHESFEDSATAALMNDLFVNIKVDREERPDIDQIYMSALHALGEQGGWPMTMFLTPTGDPVWGGTYFPPTSSYGRPGFSDVLREISRLHREEPDRFVNNQKLIAANLRSRAAQPDENPRPTPVDAELLETASARLAELIDPVHGGTRGAPKFPQMALFECLWRAGDRTGQAHYHDLVLTTLTAICQGGIYDHIGGGFSRYSVDERWLVPHFEKMLYDNAQIIDLLVTLHQETGKRLFRLRIEETVAWLANEMLQPDGAFAASLDADSEGEEGKFYTWKPRDIAAALDPAHDELFMQTYDITGKGNWEGRSIPNRLDHLSELDDPSEERLAKARAILLETRAQRIRPATDDKILSDWNGLTIAAIARASFALSRPDWLDLAKGAYRFVTESMMKEGRFAHAYRAGRSTYPGLATDWAYMIRAALTLYETTMDDAYLDDALSWSGTFDKHHAGATNHTYYLSADDADGLFMRPRSDSDDAIPAATSLMASNLVRMWLITGDPAHRDVADQIIMSSGERIGSNIYTSSSMLNALDLRLAATVAVLIRPDDGALEDPMLQAVRKSWRPNTILSVHTGSANLPATHPAHGKTMVTGRSTLYVCRDGSCSLPITDSTAVENLLTRP